MDRLLSKFIESLFDQKIHKLTKYSHGIMTKWGLFFNIVPIVIHTILPLMLQCLGPIGQKVTNIGNDVSLAL